MYFIKESIGTFCSQFLLELEQRRKLFDKAKTPKRVFSFWFFIFSLGQIGIITSLIWAAINHQNVIDALAQQAKSGNFLTFEISLILSCLVYYFEEYGEKSVRKLFFLRITLLVVAMSVAFLAMLNYIYINSFASPQCWNNWFIFYNVLLYILGVGLSYSMYITFSVVETSVAEDMKLKTDAAIEAAKNMDDTTAASIGARTVNLEG